VALIDPTNIQMTDHLPKHIEIASRHVAEAEQRLLQLRSLLGRGDHVTAKMISTLEETLSAMKARVDVERRIAAARSDVIGLYIVPWRAG
jgi:hypothetical protein